MNAKAVAFKGAHKFTGFYSFSNRSEADYVDLTWRRYQQSGRDWDQFTDWSLAKQFANTSGDEDEAYWQSSLGARRDNLVYGMADFALGDVSRVSVQPYFHANKGNGDWHAPTYGPSTWSADPIFFRQTQYNGERTGLNAKFNTSVAGNTIEAGLWYESNTTTIRRQGWGLKNYKNGPEVDFANNIRLLVDRTGDIGTTRLYVQNSNAFVGDSVERT